MGVFIFGAIFAAIGLMNFYANSRMFWLVFPDRTPPLGRKMRLREIVKLRRLYRAKFPRGKLALIELTTEILGGIAFLSAVIWLG